MSAFVSARVAKNCGGLGKAHESTTICESFAWTGRARVSSRVSSTFITMESTRAKGDETSALFEGSPGPIEQGNALRVHVPEVLKQLRVLSGDDDSLGTKAQDERTLEQIWTAPLPSSGVESNAQLAPRGAVIALLRHFGCVFCWEQARLLAGMQEELEEKERLKLIVIGIGPKEGARNLKEKIGFGEGVVYADPSMRTHKALEIPKGLGAMFNARMMSEQWRKERSVETFKKSFEGYDADTMKGLNIGQTPQLGGLAVLDERFECVFLHRERVMGDHAPVAAWTRAAGLSIAPPSTLLS
mmetsp:Transcript_4507/g.9696  ORF Transcript_4507/g.9696 Transcript_4507/m.9696 type:complete len:300 (-) Transcript_4507:47-946(-)